MFWQKMLRLSILTFVFFALPGCTSGHSEERLLGDGAADGATVIQESQASEVKIRRRPTYISEAQKTKFFVKMAEQLMRQPASVLHREFFTLPSESEISFSVGDTRDGFMVNGQSLPAPSLLLRQLPVQYERGLAYASGDLVELFVDTARVMHRKYPDTIMYLGNMSAREGGDIPYSVSHNSGRDADIGFYLLDESGQPGHPENLLHINRRFKSREEGPVYTFDIEKNTTLIETLLTHPKVHIQFIFLAKHLRVAIRRELVSRGSSADLLTRFDMSVQDQSAHDDHFHIRIYCSDTDICAGCVDKSVIHPWHEDPLPKREQCIANYSKVLERKKAEGLHKAVALQRLALLGVAPAYEKLILSHLNHAQVDVRKSAAMAAQSLDSGASRSLISQLEKESDLSVRLALVQTLSRFDKASTREAFVAELGRWASRIEGATSNDIMETVFHYISRYPHEGYVEPLLAALGAFEADWGHLSLESSVLASAVQAMGVVMNVEMGGATLTETLSQARTWLSENSGKPRQQWLVDGFKRAGFNVTTLENADIPILLDAIDGPKAISFNAQLILKALGRLKQDSLGWPIEDARWHYTRYFKRRAKKYRIDLSDRNERGIKLNAEVQP